METGHLEVRLQLLGISEEYRDIYSNHSALKTQGLVHLPGHGVLAELDFGQENYWDPEFMDEPPPTEEYEMSDAPPNWFAQAALATAVRFVASWRGGEPLTLVEFTKPADARRSLRWLDAAVADSIGCWTSIERDCALRAKCVFPSSVILRVLGLPACQERGEGQNPARVFLSGAVRREPSSWPDCWVDEWDFELTDRWERWDRPAGAKLDIPCVRFSQELHQALLVSVDEVPYWRRHGVSEWWRREMEMPHALAVGARLGVAADAKWPPGRTWLGLWAIDDRGHTEWEAPMIPLRADHNLKGLAEGAFRTLPCSLGTSDPRFVSLGPTSQTIVYLHPDSGIFMLFILPSNLRASFGESWRDYWMTRWVDAIRQGSTTEAS